MDLDITLQKLICSQIIYDEFGEKAASDLKLSYLTERVRESPLINDTFKDKYGASYSKEIKIDEAHVINSLLSNIRLIYMKQLKSKERDALNSPGNNNNSNHNNNNKDDNNNNSNYNNNNNNNNNGSNGNGNGNDNNSSSNSSSTSSSKTNGDLFLMKKKMEPVNGNTTRTEIVISLNSPVNEKLNFLKNLIFQFHSILKKMLVYDIKNLEKNYKKVTDSIELIESGKYTEEMLKSARHKKKNDENQLKYGTASTHDNSKTSLPASTSKEASADASEKSVPVTTTSTDSQSEVDDQLKQSLIKKHHLSSNANSSSNINEEIKQIHEKVRREVNEVTTQKEKGSSPSAIDASDSEEPANTKTVKSPEDAKQQSKASEPEKAVVGEPEKAELPETAQGSESAGKTSNVEKNEGDKNNEKIEQEIEKNEAVAEKTTEMKTTSSSEADDDKKVNIPLIGIKNKSSGPGLIQSIKNRFFSGEKKESSSGSLKVQEASASPESGAKQVEPTKDTADDSETNKVAEVEPEKDDDVEMTSDSTIATTEAKNKVQFSEQQTEESQGESSDTKQESKETSVVEEKEEALPENDAKASSEDVSKKEPVKNDGAEDASVDNDAQNDENQQSEHEDSKTKSGVESNAERDEEETGELVTKVRHRGRPVDSKKANNARGKAAEQLQKDKKEAKAKEKPKPIRGRGTRSKSRELKSMEKQTEKEEVAAKIDTKGKKAKEPEEGTKSAKMEVKHYTRRSLRNSSADTSLVDRTLDDVIKGHRRRKSKLKEEVILDAKKSEPEDKPRTRSMAAKEDKKRSSSANNNIGVRTRNNKRQKTEDKSAKPAKPVNKKFVHVANQVLAQISSLKYASPFLTPVNENDAPSYYSTIYSPQNLKSIKAMVKSGEITSLLELQREILLMLSNAVMYNRSNTEMNKWTKEMEAESENVFKLFWDIEKGL